MGGQNWKDADGTFRSDWSSAWVIGLAVLAVIIFFGAPRGGYPEVALRRTGSSMVTPAHKTADAGLRSPRPCGNL